MQPVSDFEEEEGGCCCCRREKKSAIGSSEGYTLTKDIWVRTLILINLSLFFVGVIGTVFGVWAIASQDSIWIRTKWDGIPVVSLLAGLMITVFSLYGVRMGQKTHKLQNFTEEVKGSFVCYFNLILLLLLAQIATVGVLTRDLHSINKMWDSVYMNGDHTDYVDVIESDVRDQITHDKHKWMDIQNNLACCGFDDVLNSDLATGDVCKLKSPISCHSMIISAAVFEIESLLIFAVIVLVLELIAVAAAVTLCCFGFSNDQKQKQGHYSRLPAGDEDFNDKDNLTQTSFTDHESIGDT